MFKHDKLNLFLFVVLVGLQVLGVVALWTRFQWTYLPIMFAIYFWAGISTTLYLHRYLTHRGFEMPGWLKFIFATGSAVALSAAIASRRSPLAAIGRRRGAGGARRMVTPVSRSTVCIGGCPRWNLSSSNRRGWPTPLKQGSPRHHR